MKKIIALLLVLVMALSLVACGGTDKPDTTPSTEPSVESTPAASDSVGASFTVVVTDLDGTESTFEYTSEAETVGKPSGSSASKNGDELPCVFAGQSASFAAPKYAAKPAGCAEYAA